MQTKRITATGTEETTKRSPFYHLAGGHMKSAQILAGITSKSTAAPPDASDGKPSTESSDSKNPSATGTSAKASSTHKPVGTTAEKKNPIPHRDTAAPRAGGEADRVEEVAPTNPYTKHWPSLAPTSDSESSSIPTTLKRQGARFFTQVDSDLSEELHSSQEIPLTNGESDSASVSSAKEESENPNEFETSAHRLACLFGSLQPLPEDCGLMASTITIVRSSTVRPDFVCGEHCLTCLKTLTAICHSANCSSSSKATPCKCQSKAVLHAGDLVWSTLHPTPIQPTGRSTSANSASGKASTKRGSSNSSAASTASKKSRKGATTDKP